MPQLNGWWDSWSDFFLQRRLAPQLAWLVRRSGALRGADVTLTLIKGGDHRLSSPGQLALLRETVLRLAERAEGISV